MARYMGIAGSTAVALMLIVAALAVAGCGSGTPKGGEIEDVNWVLSSYMVEGELKTPPADAYANALFSRGTVSGQVINSYTGSFEATEEGDLTVSALISTQIAGPQEIMDLEQAYLDNLQKTASYRAEETTLTLYDTDGKELLVYAKSDAKLTDRDWVVVAFNNGAEAVISVIPGTQMTARFSPDGKLNGNGGVNSFFGDYTYTPNGEISIGTIGSTQMAGPQNLMDQEAQYLAALKSATTYVLRGQDLELRTANGELAVAMSDSTSAE